MTFVSFVWLGENQNLKLNSWWNRKFCSWNRPISTILADSVCGIIWKAEAFQKSRAQKMSGGAAGGGAALNANSDEARTAKPDERGADARRN